MNHTCDYVAKPDLVYAIAPLIASIIVAILFAGVLLKLKRKTWKSPLRRFTIALTVSCVLYLFSFAVLIFSSRSKFKRNLNIARWQISYAVIRPVLDTYDILYSIAILATLLLQVVEPMLPEGVKGRLTPKVQHIMEATVHGAILILSFLCMISVPLTQGVSKYSDAFLSGCVSKQIITTPKFLVISFLATLLASIFFIIFFIIFVLVFFCRKFRHAYVISCQSKWMIIKLSVVFF